MRLVDLVLVVSAEHLRELGLFDGHSSSGLGPAFVGARAGCVDCTGRDIRRARLPTGGDRARRGGLHRRGPFSRWLGDSQTAPVVWNVFVRRRTDAAPEVSFVRFALAIVAFIAAAVMIGFGIAQRTVLLEPDRVSLSAEIEGEAAYTVIEPDALGAHPGKQTLTVSGSDTVFVSYGRSSDVAAWLGDSPVRGGALRRRGRGAHERGRRDRAGRRRRLPTADGATPTDSGRPAPRARRSPPRTPPPRRSDPTCGSTSSPPSARVTTTIDVPDDISVLLATDGTAPGSDRRRDRLAARQLHAVGRTAASSGGALVFLGGIAPARSRASCTTAARAAPVATCPRAPAASCRAHRSRPRSDEPGQQRQAGAAPSVGRSAIALVPLHRGPRARAERLLGRLLAELRPGRARDARRRPRPATADPDARSRRADETGDGARRHRAADGAHHAPRRGVHDRGRRRARRAPRSPSGSPDRRSRPARPTTRSAARCPIIPRRPRSRRPRSP